jgi:hypothetical protein
MTIDLGQDRHAISDCFHPWRPDEDCGHFERFAGCELNLTLERIHLTAKGIPTNRHVETTESLLPGHGIKHSVSKKDHPCA